MSTHSAACSSRCQMSPTILTTQLQLHLSRRRAVLLDTAAARSVLLCPPPTSPTTRPTRYRSPPGQRGVIVIMDCDRSAAGDDGWAELALLDPWHSEVSCRNCCPGLPHPHELQRVVIQGLTLACFVLPLPPLANRYPQPRTRQLLEGERRSICHHHSLESCQACPRNLLHRLVLVLVLR